MFVKVCGITRREDAAAAVDAGAGALGFVFWPKSPRFIDPFHARAIVAKLPPFVTAVGLFVNPPREYVSGVASLVRLGAVQLHGDESIAFAESLRQPVIRALTLSDRIDEWPARMRVLLDAHDPARRGGTGRTIDWTAAAVVATARPILLAGGITPENVAEAVARVRPFGIDVSSGVEHSPGIKDHNKIRALFEALHATSDVTARS